MGSQVAPQVDVGTLTLNGLSAFGPLLASISADNVQPMAMIQMENLGALFHINGQYAKRVPDLLQRFSSTRLDRLGIAIGWRKGDAASLMANSAGGQAISLLSMCLVNIYRPETTGEVLYELSRKVLPTSIAISSVSQLSDTAKLISAKLQVLGFGNILARQIVRIHEAYRCLGVQIPNDLLEELSSESAVNLFESLSQAFKEESTLLRITGTEGMGYILGMVMIMFPEVVCVTLENLIIQDGPHTKIYIDIKRIHGPTRTQVELVLRSGSSNRPLPIRTIGCGDESFLKNPYHFTWRGWIDDYLSLSFGNCGLVCTEGLRTACCGVIMSVAQVLDQEAKKRREGPDFLLGNLLGPYPNQRIQQVCMTIWNLPSLCISPTWTLQQSFAALVEAFFEANTALQCICHDAKCSPSSGLFFRVNDRHDCQIRRAWTSISLCLSWGFACLLVNANERSTIVTQNLSRGSAIMETIQSLMDEKNEHLLSSLTMHRAVLSLVAEYRPHDYLVGLGTDSSTIYLTGIQTLKHPLSLSAPYTLVDGRIMLNGRYQTGIQEAITAATMYHSSVKSTEYQKALVPSSSGVHSDIQITLTEAYSDIKLRTTIEVAGLKLGPVLSSCISASWKLEEAVPCQHPASIPLNKTYANQIITTSVAAPAVDSNDKPFFNSGWRSDTDSEMDPVAKSDTDQKIAIALVQSDETAQLLCCQVGVKSLLQKDCCLNCAYEQARARNFRMIICG